MNKRDIEILFKKQRKKRKKNNKSKKLYITDE